MLHSQEVAPRSQQAAAGSPFFLILRHWLSQRKLSNERMKVSKQASKQIKYFIMHSVGQRLNLRHLCDPLGGTEGLVETVGFKKMTECM